ncbi:MAG: DUF3536 domain-containing protein, partial [Anaerolineales bacterium]
PNRIAASHAIAALAHPFPVRYHRHGRRIEQVFNTTSAIGDYSLVCGHVRMTSEFTGHHTGWAYAALHLGGYNFAASTVFCDDPQDSKNVCALINNSPAEATQAELMRVLKAALGPMFYGLGDLPPSDRRRLLKVLDEDTLTDLAQSYQQIYTRHLGTIAALHEAQMPVPTELRVAAEYTLSHQLAQAAGELAREPDEAAEANMAGVLDLAYRDGIQLDAGDAVRALEGAVADGVKALVHDGQLAERSTRLSSVITAAERLGFEIRPARAQEMLLAYLRAQATHAPRAKLEPALALAERLKISDQAVTFSQ